jgi:hypothetical protein
MIRYGSTLALSCILTTPWPTRSVHCSAVHCYTRDQLLELAAAADGGFDPLIFADALGALTQITDAAFAEYGTDPQVITEMRHRFAEWRRQLIEKRA